MLSTHIGRGMSYCHQRGRGGTSRNMWHVNFFKNHYALCPLRSPVRTLIMYHKPGDVCYRGLFDLEGETTRTPPPLDVAFSSHFSMNSSHSFTWSKRLVTVWLKMPMLTFMGDWKKRKVLMERGWYRELRTLKSRSASSCPVESTEIIYDLRADSS